MPYRLIPAAGEISSPKYATVGRAYRCDDLASVAHPARNSRPAARLASHRSGLGATRRQGRRSFRRLELAGRRSIERTRTVPHPAPAQATRALRVPGGRNESTPWGIVHRGTRRVVGARRKTSMISGSSSIASPIPAASSKVTPRCRWMRRACEWSKRVMLPNPPVPADLRASEVHNPATRRRNVLLIASPVEKIALTSRCSRLSQKRLPVAAELCVR